MDPGFKLLATDRVTARQNGQILRRLVCRLKAIAALTALSLIQESPR
jgi:hypothetical protein